MSNQSNKTIELSNCQVVIKDSLTWGDKQQIEASLASGAKLSVKNNNEIGDIGFSDNALVESKYKLLEVIVIEVKIADKTQPFSRDWMNNLSIEDGDKLYNAVEEVTKKK